MSEEFDFNHEGDRYSCGAKFNYRRAANVLVSRLRAALVTAAPATRRHRDRGKVDSRSLAKLAAGTSRNVFTRRLPAENIDTAIMLHFDLSGSMNRHLPLVWKTAMVVNEALATLKIPLMISGWGGGDHKVSVVVAKAWHHPPQRLQEVIHRFRIGGGTPGAGALGWGIAELAKRPERRKIMLYLGDGVSSTPDGSLAYTEELLNRAAEQGIEVVPVAMGPGGITGFKIQPMFRTDRIVEVPDMAALDRDVSTALVKEIHRNKRGAESVAALR